MLKISTLGGLSLQLNNQPITGFITRKVDALVVYLAYEQREHSREVLANLLWDNFSQDRTLANLRTSLSNLNQHLAPSITITRQTVAFNPHSPYWLDIAELQSAIRQAQDHAAQYGSLSRSVASTLEEKLNFYHGDFLAGFHLRDAAGFEEWKIVMQENTHRQVVEGFQLLVDYLGEKGNTSNAIVQARRLVQLDPLLEDAHYLLIKTFANAGDRTGALERYAECCAVLDEELGILPNQKLMDLQQQILADTLPVTIHQLPRHNLPATATPLCGRESELKVIRTKLDDPACRLITITGLGGMGKTRLALQAAHEAVTEFSDGTFFVALNTVEASQAIDIALINTLGIAFTSETAPRQELLRYLAERQMLLVLDNFEHLLNQASVVSEILAAAPRVKLIVTSRERLNLQGEWLFELTGLPYPTQVVENLVEYPAVQLFVQTAQRLQTNFSLAGQEAAIVEICRAVDGFPLVIEMVAAWIRVIGCQEILQQLRSSLEIVTATTRDTPDRHRNLQALFDPSWQMLPASAQQAFMQLAFFRGTFTAPAAQ